MVFLGLGTNEGDRLENLERARRGIADLGTVLHISRVYETAAWGIEDQPAFLNQVLAIHTGLSAVQLLEEVLQIERRLGRERIRKWGRRRIDIDILFYGDRCLETPQLIIPHPFIAERNFVLVPMVDIAPEWVHPRMGKTMVQLLAESNDPLKVEEFLGV